MYHDLKATPNTMHWGYFDNQLVPVLTVNSGDIVKVETVTHQAGDAPDYLMDPAIENIYNSIPPETRGPGVHLLTGPIFVRGAAPGDTLEVRYLTMTARLPYGTNVSANWGLLYDVLDRPEHVTIFKIDDTLQQARALFGYDFPGRYELAGQVIPPNLVERTPIMSGVRIPMRPHIGTAGVAPKESGRISSIPPGKHGGNIDNWRIGPGSTMFYPVLVPGALFSLGDAHVSQGDGEIDGTAIEASLDILMQIVVRKDINFPGPLLETADSWYIHAFDPDLNLAARQVALDSINFLQEQRGLSVDEAYTLLSVACDFGVTQVVDQKQGIHVIIPKSLFAAG